MSNVNRPPLITRIEPRDPRGAAIRAQMLGRLAVFLIPAAIIMPPSTSVQDYPPTAARIALDSQSSQVRGQGFFSAVSYIPPATALNDYPPTISATAGRSQFDQKRGTGFLTAAVIPEPLIKQLDATRRVTVPLSTAVNTTLDQERGEGFLTPVSTQIPMGVALLPQPQPVRYPNELRTFIASLNAGTIIMPPTLWLADGPPVSVIAVALRTQFDQDSGLSLFSTASPVLIQRSQQDFPNPVRVQARAQFDHPGAPPLYKPQAAQMPMGLLYDYPNPIRVKWTPQPEQRGLPITLGNPISPMPFRGDFPNPVFVKRTPQADSNTFDPGQMTPPPQMPAGRQSYDLPVTKLQPRQVPDVGAGSWVVLEPPPQQMPFAQYDWPNPRGYQVGDMAVYFTALYVNQGIPIVPPNLPPYIRRYAAYVLPIKRRPIV